jgi:hypothetical protein
MHINQNAKQICVVEFGNGNRSQLLLAFNNNLGTAIVYQRVFLAKGKKWSPYKRSTGKSIQAIARELFSGLLDGVNGQTKPFQIIESNDYLMGYMRDNY